MKRIVLLAILPLVTTPVSSDVNASELSYTCEILNAYSLRDDGSLEKSGWNDLFHGSKFTVSRLDGQIIGQVLPTRLARRTFIVSKGNDKWSFRAAAEFKNDIQIIEVQEFKPSTEKPFQAWSSSGAGIVTGVCE